MHENVVDAVTPATLAGDLLHESAESLEAVSGEAEPLHDAAGAADVRARRACHDGADRAAPLVRFIHFYVLRLGFLDGVAGFVHIAHRLRQQLAEVREAERAARGAQRGVNRVLVTGVAGFIGMHVRGAAARARRVVARRRQPRPPTTTVELKEARLARLAGTRRLRFERLDLADAGQARSGASRAAPSPTSSISPRSRASATRSRIPAPTVRNLVALSPTCSRAAATRAAAHLVYASSSSVYGANHALPLSETTTSTTRSACTPRPRRPTS